MHRTEEGQDAIGGGQKSLRAPCTASQGTAKYPRTGIRDEGCSHHDDRRALHNNNGIHRARRAFPRVGKGSSLGYWIWTKWAMTRKRKGSLRGWERRTRSARLMLTPPKRLYSPPHQGKGAPSKRKSICASAEHHGTMIRPSSRHHHHLLLRIQTVSPADASPQRRGTTCRTKRLSRPFFRRMPAR